MRKQEPEAEVHYLRPRFDRVEPYNEALGDPLK